MSNVLAASVSLPLSLFTFGLASGEPQERTVLLRRAFPQGPPSEGSPEPSQVEVCALADRLQIFRVAENSFGDSLKQLGLGAKDGNPIGPGGPLPLQGKTNRRGQGPPKELG